MEYSKKVFCSNCRKDVFYSVKKEPISAELKGEIYNYLGKIASCADCFNEIFVSEINDYNLVQLYNEFRKQNSIISLEKLLEIPQKYNIGKRPLSLLLGWGEQTFSRYCDGDMPTKQYSEILQKVYEDPKYYLNILEENRENLKSQLSYEKSRDTTQKLLEVNNTLEESKIDIVIYYLLCKCEDITPLALQKLLYYVQGFFYAFNNSFIFKEDCEAWAHGPIFRDVYFKYKEYSFSPIECRKIIGEINISVTEKTIIDSVIKNFSCYSGKTLELFTHLETPWLSTRGDLPVSEGTDKKIDKQLIVSYFANVKDKYNMLNPSDINAYSKAMFEQILL